MIFDAFLLEDSGLDFLEGVTLLGLGGALERIVVS